MGYDDFEIETSLEEALDAKLNVAIKAINSMGSLWKKVKQGSKNSPEVKTIQQALNKLGFDAGKADGWFGKKYCPTVMAFPKIKGKVDGDRNQYIESNVKLKKNLLLWKSWKEKLMLTQVSY